MVTSGGVYTALAGKAAKSHGNHVPATQTANGATFLRNDNTWQKVKAANIGAAQIVTGSYTGTGEGGVDNPNSITVGFQPKFIFIQKDDTEIFAMSDTKSIGKHFQFFLYGMGPLQIGTTGNTDGYATVNVTFTSTGVSWYVKPGGSAASAIPEFQLNLSGKKYNYVVIG